MTKKVLIALPTAMLEQVDYIAQCEHRTRSDLIRESLRRYLDKFKQVQQSSMLMSTAAILRNAESAIAQPPNIAVE